MASMRNCVGQVLRQELTLTMKGVMAMGPYIQDDANTSPKVRRSFAFVALLYAVARRFAGSVISTLQVKSAPPPEQSAAY